MTNRRGIVNMKMGLLDALAMIAFRIRQTEESLFEKITAQNVRYRFQVFGYRYSLLPVPKSKSNVLETMGV